MSAERLTKADEELLKQEFQLYRMNLSDVQHQVNNLLQTRNYLEVKHGMRKKKMCELKKVKIVKNTGALLFASAMIGVAYYSRHYPDLIIGFIPLAGTLICFWWISARSCHKTKILNAMSLDE